jgi:hypothetical protein
MPPEEKLLFEVGKTLGTEHFLYIELKELRSQLALPPGECPAKGKPHPINVKLSII